jgi:hypothetical protein
MSNSTVQYIKTHTTASVQPSKVLRGGSSVFVRVISENGGGRYTVSFAGNRVDVQSQKKLVAGQTFTATVQMGADGKILLVPSNDVASSESPAVLPGEALSSFLAAQGLATDASMVKIMQFLQQTGVKTDVTLMQKAQKIASRFPGNEKRAAEVAILLLEKGIEPDEALVKKLLLLFDDISGGGERGTDSGNQDARSGKQKDSSGEQSASSGNQGAGYGEQGESSGERSAGYGEQGAGSGNQGAGYGEQGESSGERSAGSGEQGAGSSERNAGSGEQGGAIDRSTADNTFLDCVYEAPATKEPDLLAFVNQLSCGPKHWLFLPYEWQYAHGTAKGMIRVLVDTERKCVEKITLNCKTTLTNYYFVLYYTSSKVKEVRFCTLPPLLPSKEEELRLGELLRSGMNEAGPVTVTYSTSAYCDGICTDEADPLFLPVGQTGEGAHA